MTQIDASYPTSVKFEVYRDELLTGIEAFNSWANITADVVLTTRCTYGIMGTGQLDRVASTGSLTFTLRNDAGCIGGMNGYYTPNMAGGFGWRIGIPFRLTFDIGFPVVKFYGRVSAIKPQSGTFGARRVEVTVLDYMNYLAQQPIRLPALKENLRIDQVVTEVLKLLPIQPLSRSFAAGVDTFPTVFDWVRQNTYGLSEINKATLSELGYVYIKRYWRVNDGETLVVESRHTRTSAVDLPQLPVSAGDSGLLKLGIVGDGYILQENSDNIILDELETLDFDNSMDNMVVNFGTNLANEISVKAYPRRIDTSPVVLFSLNNPILLKAGNFYPISTFYRDPAGAATQVGAKNMITPVAVTDYTMNAASDGSGADYTANLVITTAFGATDCKFILQNTGANDGYVTKLQARGLGIYAYDPVEYIASDTTSQALYGIVSRKFEQKYQANPLYAANAAEVMLYQDKQPYEVIERIDFLANYEDSIMRAFLLLDIGDPIHIKETQTGIDAYYYIQSVSFTLGQGGIIRFSWTVKDAYSLNEVFWILGTSILGVDTALSIPVY